MQDKFEKYKEYKKNISLFYRGYPLHNILSVEIASASYNLKKLNLKSFFNFFASRKISIPHLSKNDILYSMGSYHRKDYYDLLHYVQLQAPGEIIDLNENRRVLKINFSNIINSLKHIFRKGKGLTFKEKIMFSASFTYLMNYIDELEKNKKPVLGAYVSFCSSHVNEAVMDLYFQGNNIPTFTLQHGLYFFFKNKTIDAICYENIISDKLLCWGEYTKNEFIDYGIPVEKIIVAGYPSQPKVLEKRKPSDELRILVLLSRYMFHKNNIRILDIISSVRKKNPNIHAEIKMHPSLQITDYECFLGDHGFSLCKSGTIKSLLEHRDYDMTISYNSTAYYDSYMNNCVSLRFIDEDADGSINVLDDEFYDENSLSETIIKFSEAMCTQEFWERVENRLKYISGYKINNYRDAIQSSIIS
ncbi:glycosyltransferase family 4 protein [Brenneria salicis]|uniref:glycosyltransferase family 4 protein n=1 Tax=Brenneria salicis TaxID=55214 RepID=UPI0011BFB5B7|nr:glycosyltransferase family 4 protein [Brenneria salicis]